MYIFQKILVYKGHSKISSPKGRGLPKMATKRGKEEGDVINKVRLPIPFF